MRVSRVRSFLILILDSDSGFFPVFKRFRIFPVWTTTGGHRLCGVHGLLCCCGQSVVEKPALRFSSTDCPSVLMLGFPGSREPCSGSAVAVPVVRGLEARAGLDRDSDPVFRWRSCARARAGALLVFVLATVHDADRHARVTVGGIVMSQELRVALCASCGVRFVTPVIGGSDECAACVGVDSPNSCYRNGCCSGD